MSHPSHPEHPLQKVNYQNEYTCDGCKMKGTRERYRCEKCDFDLHIDCVTCPNITVQGQNCQFLEKPRLGIHCKKVDCTECRSCDACGMTIKGFVYHCRTTDWDFHPRCAKLEDQITIDDVMFRLEKQQPSSCAWCNKKRLKGKTPLLVLLEELILWWYPPKIALIFRLSVSLLHNTFSVYYELPYMLFNI